MLWWPKRGDSVDQGDAGHSSVRWALADYAGAAPEAIASGAIVPRQCGAIEPISSVRIKSARDRQRYGTGVPITSRNASSALRSGGRPAA